MCGQILFTRDSPRSSRRCWPLHCNEDIGESAHCCSCAICEHSKCLYELIHRTTHQASRVPGLVSRAYERGGSLRGREGGGTLDRAGRLWGAWKWPDGAAATDQPLTTLSFTVILRACLKYPTFSFHIMRLHTLKFKIGFIQFLPINHLINHINHLIAWSHQNKVLKKSTFPVNLFPFQVSYQNLIYVHQMYQCLVCDHIMPATHHGPMVATN